MGFDDEDTGPIDVIDIDAVGVAVRAQVRPTTFLEAAALSDAVGAEIRIASETFQHTGSFKFRAAVAVALNVKAPHLIAASSGNFGAALALAARRANKQCTIVMPAHSSKVKIEAVKRNGATVVLVDTAQQTRLSRLEQVAAEHPDAQKVSAYDDRFVIAGNASLGLEIFEAGEPPDGVLVPVGGGGLSSGMVLARDRLQPDCPVWGAEPLSANDAARSLRAGVLCKDERESTTLCDGARTLALGQKNFAILRRGLHGIVEVSEDNVIKALGLLFRHANLKVEPTGALAVAALLQEPTMFAGKRITCVVSGGNVDAELYAQLLLRTHSGAPS
ncbi:MAG TPA: pyridoxal-phosphate dependent enzyme [Kofleriaceae bacterium]|nr:pyridoxal-phosphate dependent enzyme [Kofleriaceae bacterium]